MDQLLEGSLAPLKRYLSSSTPRPPHPPAPVRSVSTATTAYSQEERLQMDALFGDWGLDEVSSPTLVNGYGTSSEMETPIVDGDGGFDDWGMSPVKREQKKGVPVRQGLSEIWTTLKEKRQVMEEECVAFLDEFKYVLVTSQLLDETILVSRFYNKKKSSNFKLQSTKKRALNTDFGRITQLSSRYSISGTMSPQTPLTVVKILAYITKHHEKFSHGQLRTLTTILLLTLWLLVRSKNMRLSIIHTTLLSKLKDFIRMYQKSDTFSQKLLNKYKEVKIYSGLAPDSGDTVDVNQLFEIVNSTVFLSTQGLLKSLRVLLPYVNSTELENYCGIYNIDVAELVYVLETTQLMTDDLPQTLVNKIKRFQYIRRFLICVLLAFSLEAAPTTDFISHIHKVFDITDVKASSSIVEKWTAVAQTLEVLQTLQLTLLDSQTNFIELNRLKLGPIPLQQEPQRKHPLIDPTVDLSRRLKELQLSLLTFNKEDSTDDQLIKFKDLGTTLDTINQSYQSTLTQLESSTNQRQFHLSSKSRMSSRKRYSSSPIQTHFITPQTSSSAMTSPVVNHKRMSSGLTVSLLTVLEDDRKEKEKETDYITEHGLLSNDDSVVISSNADTTFEGMTGEELKRQLENNFGKLTGGASEMKENEDMGELSKNDQKLGEEEAGNLMSELRLALKVKNDV